VVRVHPDPPSTDAQSATKRRLFRLIRFRNRVD